MVFLRFLAFLLLESALQKKRGQIVQAVLEKWAVQEREQSLANQKNEELVVLLEMHLSRALHLCTLLRFLAN